jgi:hypothetical protein
MFSIFAMKRAGPPMQAALRRDCFPFGQLSQGHGPGLEAAPFVANGEGDYSPPTFTVKQNGWKSPQRRFNLTQNQWG